MEISVNAFSSDFVTEKMGRHLKNFYYCEIQFNSDDYISLRRGTKNYLNVIKKTFMHEIFALIWKNNNCISILPFTYIKNFFVDLFLYMLCICLFEQIKWRKNNMELNKCMIFQSLIQSLITRSLFTLI